MKRRVSVVALLGALVTAGVAASQDVSAVPPAPSQFAAPADDPAGRVARQIAALVPRLPNLRARVRLGQWRLDERASWSVRARGQCLDELERLGIVAEPFMTSLTPIPTPVRIRSEIGGVRYRKRAGGDFIISCELALRLARTAEMFRAHGIHTIEVSSSWRRAPHTSFHRMGLAIDVVAFHRDRGSWIVERDYTADRRHPTCPAPPESPPLRRLACELADTGIFSTVITPSYSPGHRDHFHLDARPDDPRVFVR